MKIKQDSEIRSSLTAGTSQTELKNQTAIPPSAENATALKQSEALKVGQQRIATEAKGFSNLSAGLLQKSLASALPSRAETLNNTAAGLVPKLPEMITRSGNDPDSFVSAVSEELAASPLKVLGGMNGQDIEAIAFLVLMQAAKSAQEDLKAIMAKVKNINQAKAQMRELLTEAQKSSAHRKDDD